jgi:hypothetical protein
MGDRDSDKDDEQRMASGWGRRPATPAERDWSPAGRDRAEAEEDLQIEGDAGAISGRASTEIQSDEVNDPQA